MLFSVLALGMSAQGDYASLWKQCEKAEKKDQPKTALYIARKIEAKAEKEAGELEKILADPETYRDPEAAAETTRKYHLLQEEINRLYSEWESLENEE